MPPVQIGLQPGRNRPVLRLIKGYYVYLDRCKSLISFDKKQAVFELRKAP